MKGYKASVKGKCRNQVYEVGKTYKIEFESEGEIRLCNSGFHFCEDPNDVLTYYKPTDNNLVIFEVEALGEIKSDKDKSVTDEIKIIKEITKQEYNNLFSNFDFKFDSNDNMIWLKNSDNLIWEFKYDSNNNLIWSKDFAGYIWEYKYDENNNLIWEKNFAGYFWEFKYDSNNNLIWSKDSEGYICELKYDFNNNLIQKKDSFDNIWEFKYDSNNNLIQKKDLFDNNIEYKYDFNNNYIWKKDVDGEIFRYPSYKVISY